MILNPGRQTQFRLSTVRHQYSKRFARLLAVLVAAAAKQVPARPRFHRRSRGRLERQLERIARLGAAARRRLRPTTRSASFAGLLVGEIAVQHRQRLARLRRDEAGLAAGIDIRKVERREQRRQQRSLHVNVNAAPALLFRRRFAPAVARPRLRGQHLLRQAWDRSPGQTSSD